MYHAMFSRVHDKSECMYHEISSGLHERLFMPLYTLMFVF